MLRFICLTSKIKVQRLAEPIKLEHIVQKKHNAAVRGSYDAVSHHRHFKTSKKGKEKKGEQYISSVGQKFLLC